jgi:hypothetical protein
MPKWMKRGLGAMEAAEFRNRIAWNFLTPAAKGCLIALKVKIRRGLAFFSYASAGRNSDWD